MSDYKPTIVIDFDGVIHSYTSPWTKPEEIPDPPVSGALQAISEYLLLGYEVVIQSTRAVSRPGHAAMRQWLDNNHFPHSIPIMFEKPAAILYIDDRGWRFEGRFPSAQEIDQLKSTWNKP
jgi:hypothetical protein